MNIFDFLQRKKIRTILLNIIAFLQRKKCSNYTVEHYCFSTKKEMFELYCWTLLLFYKHEAFKLYCWTLLLFYKKKFKLYCGRDRASFILARIRHRLPLTNSFDSLIIPLSGYRIIFPTDISNIMRTVASHLYLNVTIDNSDGRIRKRVSRSSPLQIFNCCSYCLFRKTMEISSNATDSTSLKGFMNKFSGCASTKTRWFGKS